MVAEKDYRRMRRHFYRGGLCVMHWTNTFLFSNTALDASKNIIVHTTTIFADTTKGHTIIGTQRPWTSFSHLSRGKLKKAQCKGGCKLLTTLSNHHFNVLKLYDPSNFLWVRCIRYLYLFFLPLMTLTWKKWFNLIQSNLKKSVIVVQLLHYTAASPWCDVSMGGSPKNKMETLNGIFYEALDPPHPPLMDIISRPHFFPLHLNLTHMRRIFTLGVSQNYHF